MTAATADPMVGPERVAGRWLPGGLSWRGPARLVERHATAYRRSWPAYASGIVEPFLYLLSIGIGVGALVGDFAGPTGVISYPEFVAPGLLAAAAMNGALMDTTIGFFVKFKYIGTYDAALATPLRPRDVAVGEVAYSVARGGVYAASFLFAMWAMGLVASWWAVFAVPVALLIGFAFAGAGLAGATFMRSWVDFDLVNLALLPLFLFSAVFFPLSQYGEALALVVGVSPLYQGVDLERSLVLGDVGWVALFQVLYLGLFGALGISVAARRLRQLVQP